MLNACKGSKVHIDCDNGNLINISSAYYVYTRGQGCDPDDDNTDKCYKDIQIYNQEYYTGIIAACQMKPQCDPLTTQTMRYHTTCSDYIDDAKYISILYRCVQDPRTGKSKLVIEVSQYCCPILK